MAVDFDLEGYKFDKGSQPKLVRDDFEWSLARKRSLIYAEIERERNRQDEKWGGPKHDDTKGVRDWVSYIVVYLGKAVDNDSKWGRDLSISRIGLVKVAALCVAALESFDREMTRRVEGARPDDL